VAIDTVEMGGVSCDVWDFAGQEVYYHGHKLFMTSRCVYVLVTRAPVAVECFPAADESALDFAVRLAVDGWVRQIHCRAPSATIVAVVTHSNRRDAEGAALHARFAAAVGIELKRLRDALNKELRIEWEEISARLDDLRHSNGDGAMLERLEKRQQAIRDSNAKTNEVAQLNLVLDGNTPFCVDCRSGEGVVSLKEALIEKFKQQWFFNEQFPRVWTHVLDVAKRWTSSRRVSLVDLDAFVVSACESFKEKLHGTKMLEVEAVRGGMRFWASQMELVLMASARAGRVVVFPQPRQLIDVITPLLHHDIKRKVRGQGLQLQVDDFESRGVLREELLRELWWECVADDARADVVALLQEANIISPFVDERESRGVKIYVVPAQIVPHDVDMSSVAALLDTCQLLSVQYDLTSLPREVSEGIRCRLWLRHFCTLRRTHHVVNTPRQVVLHSDRDLESDFGSIRFGEEPPSIQVLATGRGMLRLCCGVVESLTSCDSFVGIRVKRIEVGWGDSEGRRLRWKLKGEVQLEDVLGVRTLMEKTLAKDGVRELPLSRVLRLEGQSDWDEQIFFSHKWGDWTDTSNLVRLLRSEVHHSTPLQTWCDFDVFPDARDVIGTNFRNGMTAAINACKVVVLFLTKEYLGSDNCLFEAESAFATGRVVIPLAFDDDVQLGSNYWQAGDRNWSAVHRKRVARLHQRLRLAAAVCDAREWKSSWSHQVEGLRCALAGVGRGPEGRHAVDVFLESVLKPAMAKPHRKKRWDEALSAFEACCDDRAVAAQRVLGVPRELEEQLFDRLAVNGGRYAHKYELYRGLLDVGVTQGDITRVCGDDNRLSKEDFVQWVRSFGAAQTRGSVVAPSLTAPFEVSPGQVEGVARLDVAPSFSILANALRGHLTLRQYEQALRSAGLNDGIIADFGERDVFRIIDDALPSILLAHRSLIKSAIVREKGGRAELSKKRHRPAK
jgi:hypothetical protein